MQGVCELPYWSVSTTGAKLHSKSKCSEYPRTMPALLQATATTHLHKPAKLKVGNEVGMRPLIIQELQLILFLSRQWCLGCLLALTPARYDNGSSYRDTYANKHLFGDLMCCTCLRQGSQLQIHSAVTCMVIWPNAYNRAMRQDVVQLKSEMHQNRSDTCSESCAGKWTSKMIANDIDLKFTWLENSGHLFDIQLLVWHVLAGLTGPHQVKGVIWEVQVEGIHDLEAAVAQTLLRC